MNRPATVEDLGIRSFSVTELKERAREVINLASQQPVAISRHNVAEAVLISPSDYAEFVALKRERLGFLAQRYDELVRRMQTPAASAGIDALFDASGEDLGRAAVTAARRD